MWNVVAKFLCLSLLVVALAGCASVDPVVKIGLVAPFEGRYRAIGYDALYSARLAVREINAAGGVGGHRVALVALDDRGDVQLARDAAASLVVDPGVVAVVGHYLPETTGAVLPIYEDGGLPLVTMGDVPFAAVDPDQLPAAFRDAYAAVTPFDETAGPYAGPTYDALGLLAAALAMAEESSRTITRASVQAALGGLEYEGVTGEIVWP